MDKFKSVLKPKANPQEQLRGWQRRLRQECRNIERQIRGMFSFFSFSPFFFLLSNASFDLWVFLLLLKLMNFGWIRQLFCLFFLV